MEGLIGVECEVCGGSNFYKESGYYFCNECQTQTQEIREQVFEDYDHQELAKSRLIKKPKSENAKTEANKLTSWECYNYVLKGLSDELVTLGADRLLKIVIKRLWFQYLHQTEVLGAEKPKLQAVSSKIDAEIVYGKRQYRKRKIKKRSRTSSGETDLSSLDKSSLQRERAKRKRALVKSQYEHAVSSRSEKTSLMNETLSSLKSTSENLSEKSIPVAYNTFAKTELRKRQSRKHLDKHLTDFDNDLKCHASSYNTISYNYKHGAHLLSINKIYSILYLGLLLIKSRIQLCDMLRFIREGHLSFNNYKHFFPEDLQVNPLTKTDLKTQCLSPKHMRITTLKMVKFLDISKFIKVQNLVEMIQRFCKELNLPDEIKQRTLGMLSVTLPEMKIKARTSSLPNYEGRALSLILFQLKLLFGLDGRTENEFARYANLLNKSDLITGNMFNVMDWLQYLNYRKTVISRYHFPTQFYFDKSMKNSDLFLQFMLSKNPDYDKIDVDKKYIKAADDCRHLLDTLKKLQIGIEEPIYFPVSFTPFADYTHVIVKSQHITYVERDILEVDFTNCNLDYLTNPIDHLKLVNKNEKVKTKHRGANANIQLFKLENSKAVRQKSLCEGRKLEFVKIRKERDVMEECASTSVMSSSIKVENVDEYLEQFKENHEGDFKNNSKLNKSKRMENPVLFDVLDNDLMKEEQRYSRHFNPHECYWINTHFNLKNASKKIFASHFDSYPYDFRLVFEEIVRIGEQNPQEFLYEFTMTELYLVYVHAYGGLKNINVDDVKDDKYMKILIRQAKQRW